MVRKVAIEIAARQTVSAAANKAANAASKLQNTLKRTGAAAKSGAAGVRRLAAGLVALRARASAAGAALAGKFMTGLGAITMIAGLASSAFNALKNGVMAVGEAMDDSGGEATGAGGDYAEAGKDADKAATSFDKAAKTTEKAAATAKVAFGAFGDVGAGFVMKAGSVTKQAEDTAKAAVASATAAGAAMDDATESTGKAEKALGSFGKETSRLADGWNKAKKVLLQAIGKAMLPLISKLADMMEDPRFQKFIQLLADDLAKALGVVVDWLIKKVIPALLDFFDRMNEAGGPVNYVKGVFKGMVEKLEGWMDDLRDTWHGTWENIKSIFSGVVASLRTGFQDWIDYQLGEFNTLLTGAEGVWGAIATAATTAFEGLQTSVNGIAASIESRFVKMVNGIIKALNVLIKGYNALGGVLGLDAIKEITPLQSFAQGAIVSRPTMALVGDTPNGSPEVVAPLDKLAEMLRAEGGGLGGGITVNVYGATATNAFALGQEAGAGIADQLRRAGVRLQTI